MVAKQAQRGKMKFAADELVECVMSFSVDVEGASRTIVAGTRLRGSNDLVKRFPGYFISDGASDQEKVAAYHEIAGPPVEPDSAPIGRVLPLMVGDDVVEATDDWNTDLGLVSKGARFRKSDERVRRWPHIFKPLES